MSCTQHLPLNFSLAPLYPLKIGITQGSLHGPLLSSLTSICNFLKFHFLSGPSSYSPLLTTALWPSLPNFSSTPQNHCSKLNVFSPPNGPSNFTFFLLMVHNPLRHLIFDSSPSFALIYEQWPCPTNLYFEISQALLHHKWLLRSPASYTAAICHHSTYPSYRYQLHVPALFATIPLSHLVLQLNKNRSWFLPMAGSVLLPHSSFRCHLLLECYPATLIPNSTYYSNTNSKTLVSWRIPGACQSWIHIVPFCPRLWYTHASSPLNPEFRSSMHIYEIFSKYTCILSLS